MSNVKLAIDNRNSSKINYRISEVRELGLDNLTESSSVKDAKSWRGYYGKNI